MVTTPFKEQRPRFCQLLHLKCLVHPYFLATHPHSSARSVIDCNATVLYTSKTAFCFIKSIHLHRGERFKYPHNFSNVEYPRPISLISNTDRTFM